MRHQHSIFGLRIKIFIGLIFLLSINSLAQTKRYSRVMIDSLEIINLKMGNKDPIKAIYDYLNDTVSLKDILNDVIYECCVIKDPIILDSLSFERNWKDNCYIGRIPVELKPGQFAIDNSIHNLYMYDKYHLIRIPIKSEQITNLNSIQLIPLESPPKDFQLGTIYFDKKSKKLKYYNGNKWRKL